MTYNDKIEQLTEVKSIAKTNKVSLFNPEVIKKISLGAKEVLVSLLNLNHPLYKLVEINPNEYYIKEFKHFDGIGFPMVTLLKDNTYDVLSNKEDVIAAKNSHLRYIKVIIVEGLDEDEIPRFIHFRSFYKNKGYKNQFDIMTWLENHFKTNCKGEEWANSIQGDMKKKLATVLGVSESSIQNLKLIGKYDRELLIQLDNKEVSLSRMLETLRNKKEKADPIPLTYGF